ncbi:MAG: EVE domain-containing protein [Bacteroidota bacterium]|nr:EVE domain-containing protein [Bacteroidota bacterium]
MSDYNYWIVVASKDHVEKGIKEGIAQACHGKLNPLKRMKKGDGIIYYSSKEKFNEDAPFRKFTAIGRISDSEVYQIEMDENFSPFRRNVNFYKSREVPIEPILEHLSFIVNKKHWGYPFRFGILQIPRDDFLLIANEMLENIEVLNGEEDNKILL